MGAWSLASRIRGLDIVLFQDGRQVSQQVGHVIGSTGTSGDSYGKTGKIPGLGLCEVGCEKSYGVTFMDTNLQSIARVHRFHNSSRRKVNHRFCTMRRKIRASIEYGVEPEWSKLCSALLLSPQKLEKAGRLFASQWQSPYGFPQSHPRTLYPAGFLASMKNR
jgi:hypothetical protein